MTTAYMLRSAPGMKKRRVIFGSVVFTLALHLFSGAALAAPQGPPTRGVFLYSADKHHNSRIVDDLKALNINRIYMRVKPEWLSHQHEKTRDIVSWAHEAGMKVYAIMLEEPDYAYDGRHAQGIDEVKKLVDYCKRMKTERPDAAFDGLMVDVQPHKLFRGGETPGRDELKQRKKLMKGYEGLLRLIKKEIKVPGLQLELAATVAWWYNEKGKDNVLPDAKASKLGRQADVVVPLVFGGIGVTADDIIRKTEDEVASTSTMIAIGADEFGSYGSLLAAIEGVEKKFRLRKKFGGIIIYHYGTLSARVDENF